MASGSIFNGWDYSDDLNDILICVVCETDVASQLIQLECLHLCHASCIDSLVRQYMYRQTHIIRCPVCDSVTWVPNNDVEELPKELLQNKRQEIADIFSNTFPKCEKCEDFKDSSYFCITCKLYLCSADIGRHSSSNHNVVSVSEIHEERYLSQVLPSANAVCGDHQTDSEQLEFYCQSCRLSICRVCKNTNHNDGGHETKSLGEASKILKKKIESHIERVSVGHHAVENLLDEIDIECDQNVRKCEIWGERLKAAIDKIVEKNVLEINDTAQRRKGKVEKIAKSNILGKLQDTQDYMALFLMFASDSELSLKYRDFVTRLQYLEIKKNTIVTRKLRLQCRDIQETEHYLQKQLCVITEKEILQVPRPYLFGFELIRELSNDEELDGVFVDGKGSEILCVVGNTIKVVETNGTQKVMTYKKMKHQQVITLFKDHLYVTDKAEKNIKVVKKNGKTTRIINLPKSLRDDFVIGLALDQSRGDLFIGSVSSNTVYICFKGQSRVEPFITTGLNKPQYLCVAPTHELIVSNQGSGTVCKYGSNGILVWEYGCLWAGNNGLLEPRGVCVDPWGHTLVADYRKHCIHHLSPDGIFLSLVDIGRKLQNPSVLAFDEKTLIVSLGLDFRTRRSETIVIKCKYINDRVSSAAEALKNL